LFGVKQKSDFRAVMPPAAGKRTGCAASAASPSRGKCGRHLVLPSGRGSAAIASKTIPSLVVASATVRFVAVAILEVPIAGRARWFVQRSRW